MEEAKRPKVGVAIIVIKDGKILFGKRKGSHGAGTWAPPGGHLEFREQPEECVYRELEEEVGIKIKNLHRGPYTNDIFEEDNKHFITIFMVAEYESGEVEVREPDKCEKWEWFDWANLPSPLFVPIQNLLTSGYSPA